MSDEVPNHKEVTYIASDKYILRTVADENILMAIDGDTTTNGALMMLNDTGAFIWKQLQQEITFTSLVLLCRKEFEEQDDMLTNEILEFLNVLIKRNLIVER